MVAATNASDSAARSTNVTGARSTSDRKRESAEVPDLAFEALLSATQALAAGAGRKLEGPTSASQVFEANAPKGERARSGAVREEIDGGARTDGGAGRFDRTSIDARASRLPNDAGANGRDLDPDQSRASSVDSRDAAATAVRGEQASNSAGKAQPSGETQVRDNARAFRSPDQASPTAAPVVSSVSQVAQDASQSKNSAQQVARILGVQRAGNTSSARAVAPTAAPVRSPSSSQNPLRGDRALGKQESTPRTSPGRADRSATESPQTAFEKLVSSIRLNGSARSTARIRLDPPDLGRILVDVRVDGEEVRIDVRTENAEAKQLLQGRASQLTDALSQHGIDVERFDVTHDGAGGSQSNVADFANAGQAGLQGRDAGRGDSHDGARRAYDHDRAAIAAWDVESETWVVSETRLDVKV